MRARKGAEYWARKGALGLLVLSLASPAAAQAPTAGREYFTTYMSWFETDLVVKLGGHFGTQVDIQVRTAADQEGQPDRNSANIFENPFQLQLRPWLFYDLGTTGLRFSLAPMGYVASWGYFEGSNTFSPEARTSLQVQYNSRAGKVYLTNRLRYEFRWTGPSSPVNGGWSIPSGANDGLFTEGSSRGRLRYMLRAWVPLGHRNLEKGAWYLATFDEVFLGFGQDVPSTNTFDQNRFYIGIGRQEGSRIRWEVGYMNQVRTRYNKAPDFNNVDVNHILATWLFFDDLAKVF